MPSPAVEGAVVVYDVSMEIRWPMPTWPGDPRPRVRAVCRMARGAASDVSAISLCAHTGTHVDAPAHFVPGGATIADVPSDLLVGPAFVCEVDGDGHIAAERLERAGVPPGAERVLLRTANSRAGLLSRLAFEPGFAALEPDGAAWLVARGVRLLGVDYLSVDPAASDGFPAHRRLLGAGMVVVEGCDLSRVTAGEYLLVCAPLRLTGCEAAPARVLLLRP